MIRRVTFENFCSFQGEAELDFRTKASTPTDDSFTSSLVGDKLSILAGVFGPNASGKTNLLKTLAFLNFFLRGSYGNQKADDPIPVDCFMGEQSKQTRILVEFENSQAVYRYEVTLTPREVVKERISRRNTETRSFRTLILREHGKRGPRLSQPSEFTDLSALRALLKDRANASILAAGLVTGRDEFRKINRALGGFQTNVDRMGKLHGSSVSQFSQLIECATYLEENSHFKADIERRLKMADLGISQFLIKHVEIADDKTGETRQVPLPYVVHKTRSGEFEIPLTIESAGTQRLFVLLRTFLPVLTDGGIAVIDEMESDLHPHLIPLLLDLFVDRATNPKRAQLLFTCHHVEVLNQLAKEQIILVDKDDLNASKVYRLADIKGVRREENFFSNYNAGRYEAIPQPELF